MAEAIHAHVKAVRDNQKWREGIICRNLELYGGAQYLVNERGRLSRKAADNPWGPKDKMGANLVKSVVDTQNAKIAVNKPKPFFLTQNGDFSLKRRAERLNQAIEGLFLKERVYHKTSAAQLESAIFGRGFVQPYHEDGAVRYEKIFPGEIVVDDEEARFGEPVQIHKCKPINVDTLIANFDDMEKEILEASRRGGSDLRSSSTFMADDVEVIESWHLPSADGYGDGLHVWSVGNAVLKAESWELRYFPIASCTWGDPILGYWPVSLVEEVTPLQRELNKLLRLVQDSMHLVANPRIYVERGSRVNKRHINNLVAGIIEYQGTPPIVDTPPSISPEVLQHIQWIVMTAYQLSGVSQMAATAQAPRADLSGIAIRSMNDLQTERFSQRERSYEQMHVDLAQMTVDILKDIVGKEGELELSVPGSKFLNKIKWSEVDMEEDLYEIKVHPTNFLPSTPSGKWQTISEMLEAGFLDRDQGQKLMEYPDLESVTGLNNAHFDDIEATIEDLLDGKRNPPEPFQNLQLGINMIQSAYLKARRDNAPEHILELMRQWIEEATGLIETAAQQAAEAQAMAAPPGGEQLPLPLPPEQAGLEGPVPEILPQ